LRAGTALGTVSLAGTRTRAAILALAAGFGRDEFLRRAAVVEEDAAGPRLAAWRAGAGEPAAFVAAVVASGRGATWLVAVIGRRRGPAGSTRFAAGGLGLLAHGGNLGHVALEIDARRIGQLLAELVAQDARLHHLDRSDRQVAQLE